jgi:hypothetical protein
MEKNPECQIDLCNPALITVTNYILKISGLTEAEIKNRITQYFLTSDVIGLFQILSRQDGNFVVSAALATEIYDILAGEYGEKKAEDNIESCLDPAFAKELFKIAKEKCLLFIKAIIKKEFDEPIRNACVIARQRKKTERVLQ